MTTPRDSFVRRNAGALVAGAFGAGLAIWFFAGRAVPDPAIVEAEARARFTACLIGVPPGPATEQRLAEVAFEAQLAQVADWPKRCKPYAEALDAVSKAPTRLASLLEAYDGKANFDYAIKSATQPYEMPAIDFAAVTRGVPRPPEPRALVRAAAPLHERGVDVVPSDPDLRLQLADVTCRLAPKDGGLEPIARCSFRADALAAGSEHPEPIVPATATATATAAPDSELYVRADSGALVTVRHAEPAWTLPGKAWAERAARVEGVFYAWLGLTKQPSIAVGPAGAPPKLVPLAQSRDLGLVEIVGDQLLWSERKGGTFVRSITGGTPGPVVELSKQRYMRDSDPCVMSATAAVPLLVDDDKSGREYGLALRVGPTWKLLPLDPKARAAEAQCHAGGFTAIHVGRDDKRDVDGTLVRFDCTLDGCKSTTGKLPGREIEIAAAAAIGNEVIAVWGSDRVWMVRGPLESLATAKPVPLFDAFANNKHFRTNGMLVHRVAVFVRGTSAIVTLETEGTIALHVRDGKVEPVRVVYE